MSIPAQMYKSIKALPGEGIAGGYVDLSNRRLICMLMAEPYEKAVLNRMAGITEDLFQGQNVLMIENLFRELRGQQGKAHFFKEMVVMNDNIMHIFIRGRTNPEHVITFALRGSRNLVHALVVARAETFKLEAEYQKTRHTIKPPSNEN